ncbi:MAG: ATP-binding protein [Acidimicrobiia bacterium]
MTRRLLLSYLTITAFVLVVLEVPLALTYENSQIDQLTADVERDARVLSGRVAGAPPEAAQQMADEYRAEVGGRAVVVDAAGTSVADSDAAAGRDFSTRPEIAQVLADGDVASGTRHSDTLDENLLYVAVPVASPAGELLGAVRITYPTTAIDRRVRRYWLSLAGLAVVVLGAVTAVGFFLARSVTRPVLALEHAAERVARGDLRARAPTDTGPPEIRSLAEQFNTMAARLEELVGAQRTFVADASHELRTPLTALRLRLENLQQAPNANGADFEAAADEVARLARLVDGLLELARAEGARPEREMVDISTAAHERVAVWQPLAEEQGVRLVLDCDAEDTHAQTVPGAVAQVLDNLLANALDAAPPTSDVVVRVTRADGFVELHVVDSGQGLSADERLRAFDRFWRAPGAESGGTGLGLAIVAQLAAASGGDAALLPGAGAQGTDAQVRFRR